MAYRPRMSFQFEIFLASRSTDGRWVSDRREPGRTCPDAEQSRGQKFFVYGAIFVPQEGIKPLNDGVEIIRAAAKFEPSDSLKFADKTRPSKIPKETFREVKA